MKNLLLPFLLFLFSLQTFSQSTFQKIYDFGGDDYGNNVTLVNTAVYVCGSTNHANGSGGYDAMLMRFDTLGNLLWQSQFGGAFGEVGRALTAFPKGDGILVAGGSQSISPSHLNDITVSLIDTSGKYQGSIYYGFDSLVEFANDIVISPVDSGLVLTGQTEANATGGHTNMFVIRTDKEVNPLFMKTYGLPTSNEVGLKIFDLPEIGIIAMGSSDVNTSAGQSDAFIAHIDDSTGQLKDQILIGTAGHDDGRYFLVNNNQLIIGGMTGSVSGPPRNDIFITALNPDNLSIIWSKVYGGDSATALSSLNVDPIDGNLIVGGHSNSYGTGEGGILFKVDSANGNVIWANLLDGPDNDFLNGVAVAPDGSIIITGNTGTATNDVYLARASNTGVLCNNTPPISLTALDYAPTISFPSLDDSDVVFPFNMTALPDSNFSTVSVVDLCASTGVRTLSAKDNSITIYPNPTSGRLFIESTYGFSNTVKMQIYNTIGSEVFTKTIAAGTKDFNIDLSGSPKGMYIVTFNDGTTITTEKISLN